MQGHRSAPRWNRPGEKARERLLGHAAFALVLIALAVLLASCGESPSVMDPQSDRASRIATVWWILLGAGTAVYVVVSALLVVALFHRRERLREAGRDPVRIVVIGGVAIPAVILIGIVVLSIWALPSVIPEEAEAQEGDIEIEVVGHRWWWEFRYPDADFTTANEMHIPAGETVVLRLTSADVIHSFWVPQLQGKADTMPGRETTLVLEANTPGTYRGLCAEYCGIQHANMGFLVIVEEPEDYAAWVEEQQEPAERPTDPQIVRGQDMFFSSGCVYCHAVEGTSASGQIGPDLTHVASRETLAAAMLPNTTANLRAWILNPQGIKHGNLMPPTRYDSIDELEQLIAYLESLE